MGKGGKIRDTKTLNLWHNILWLQVLGQCFTIFMLCGQFFAWQKHLLQVEEVIVKNRGDLLWVTNLPFLLVSHQTHNLLCSKWDHLGSTPNKSINQSACCISSTCNNYSGFWAICWSCKVKSAKHRRKTCNKTMLHDKLKVFVSRVSPP